MSDLIPSEPQRQEKSYRVLARKYRPANFDELIGQEPMVRTLRNAFKAGRIAQAWMLTGVRGVGKTTTARILARALNYKTAETDAPSVDLAQLGEHCQAIMEGRHVDVIEIDAASHTGIDNIREIIEQVRYRPVSARYKVYVIDEVHMLSTSAFNALLKTLEEPPPHVKFIFATTEIRKVPITILSRCQRFDLRRVEAGTIVRNLRMIAEKEGITVDDDSLAMIARAGEGSVRDSQSIFDQAIAYGNGAVDREQIRAMLGLADRARVIDLFEHLMRGRMKEALAEFREQYDSGADPVAILTDLSEFCHLVTRIRFVPEAAGDFSLTQDERERGRSLPKHSPPARLSRAWQMLLKGITETGESSRPATTAEMALIRLAHAADLPPLDEVVKGLGERPRRRAGFEPRAKRRSVRPLRHAEIRRRRRAPACCRRRSRFPHPRRNRPRSPSSPRSPTLPNSPASAATSPSAFSSKNMSASSSSSRAASTSTSPTARRRPWRATCRSACRTGPASAGWSASRRRSWARRWRRPPQSAATD